MQKLTITDNFFISNKQGQSEKYPTPQMHYRLWLGRIQVFSQGRRDLIIFTKIAERGAYLLLFHTHVHYKNGRL